MKPKHQGGYNPDHTVLCERTLVTLLRGLGPWKQGIYIVGGVASLSRASAGHHVPLVHR